MKAASATLARFIAILSAWRLQHAFVSTATLLNCLLATSNGMWPKHTDTVRLSGFSLCQGSSSSGELHCKHLGGCHLLYKWMIGCHGQSVAQ